MSSETIEQRLAELERRVLGKDAPSKEDIREGPDFFAGAHARKKDLLEEAEGKPVRTLLQVDGWNCPLGWHDDVIHQDRDGHAICWGVRDELRSTDNDVRVHVNPKADRRRTVALLHKIAALLERDWDSIVDPCPGLDG